MPTAPQPYVTPAGRVYATDREKALRRAADLRYVESLGRHAAAVLTRRLTAKATAAYRAGNSPVRAVAEVWPQIRSWLAAAMVFARLQGSQRALKDAPPKARPPAIAAAGSSASAYDRATAFMRRRLNLTPADLRAMNDQISKHVVPVVADVSRSAQAEIQQALAEITRDNLHVKDAVDELRDAFNRAGVGVRSAANLEAIFRTQTQLAYSAGNAEALSDPDVDQYLWGYKYVTVGDDRVRPEHAAIEGVTLPKDDPFWDTNMPPCGWNCRCQVIPLFEERKPVPPPGSATSVNDDGEETTLKWIGADPGFRFNPARLLPPVA